MPIMFFLGNLIRKAVLMASVKLWIFQMLIYGLKKSLNKKQEDGKNNHIDGQKNGVIIRTAANDDLIIFKILVRRHISVTFEKYCVCLWNKCGRDIHLHVCNIFCRPKRIVVGTNYKMSFIEVYFIPVNWRSPSSFSNLMAKKEVLNFRYSRIMIKHDSRTSLSGMQKGQKQVGNLPTLRVKNNCIGTLLRSKNVP